MINIGRISYSLFWIALVFIFIIAIYYLVQKPFRQKYIISRKTFLISLVTTLLIFGSYLYYSTENIGIKERHSQLVALYGKNEVDNKILNRNSWNILNGLALTQGMVPSEPQGPSAFETDYLWFSNNPATKKVLILGNSHSKDLFNALYLNKEFFPDLEFARFGMANVLFIHQVNALFKSPNFINADIVIIAFRYSDLTIELLPNFIQSLQDESKDVVLVLNINEFDELNGKPVFDGYIESLLQYSPTSDERSAFSSNDLKKLFFEMQGDTKDEINQSLREIANTYNITVLNKMDFICDVSAETCDGITDDGYKAFYDYGHFTLEGAEHFGQRIHELNWLVIE